jgi:hypothetical protein
MPSVETLNEQDVLVLLIWYDASSSRATVSDHPVQFLSLRTHLKTPPEALRASAEDLLQQYGYDDTELKRSRVPNVIGQ